MRINSGHCAGCLFIVTGLVISGTVTASDTAASPWQDPRLARWNEDYLAGRLLELKQALEADLVSAQPHPFAAHYWFKLFNQREEVDEALKQASPRLRQGLEMKVAAFQLYENEQYEELLAKYPTSKANEIHDPFLLMLVGWAADNLSRTSDRLVYASAGVRRWPWMFGMCWDLSYLGQYDDYRRRGEVQALLKSGELDSACQAFLDALTLRRNGELYDLDSVVAGEAYASIWPGDARNARFLGSHYGQLQRWGEAASAYGAANRTYPVYWNDEEAQMLIRLGRHEEATALIERSAHLSKTPIVTTASTEKTADRIEHEVAWRLAAAYRETGDLGQARELLDAALQRWPESHRLNTGMTTIELASNRGSEAIHYAEQAYHAKPEWASRRSRLLEAYRKGGQATAGVEHALRFVAEQRYRSESLYHEATELLIAAQRLDAAVEVARQAAKAYPQSAWIQRQLARVLAEARQPQEALQAIEHALQLEPSNAWALDRWREYLTELHNKVEADRRLAAFREEHPWIQKLWEDAAKEVTADESKIAVWREARSANPDQVWPWQGLMNALADAERWPEALEAAEGAVDLARHQSPGRKNHADEQRIALLQRATYAGALDQVQLERAIQLCEHYLEVWGGSFAAWLYERKSGFLKGLGRYEESAEAMLRSSTLDPDRDTSYELVRGGHVEFLRAKAWRALNRWVDRNPYDARRLVLATELHAKWGGSPIMALHYSRLWQERAPNSWNRDRAAIAYSHLGDAIRGYTDTYASDLNGPSPSARYVGWYENSRLGAQQPPRQVTVDLNTLTATIIHPDGRVERRRDHPVTGQPTLRQVGAAMLELEYDDTGQLTELRTSAGHWMRIRYDDAARISHIQDQDTTITFRYNAAGKPDYIEATGLGSITLKYNAAGEVQDVTSDAGPQVAFRVRNAFQSMLRLMEMVESVDALEQIPVRDDQRNELEEAYYSAYAEALKSDEPAILQTYYAARLALAQHLTRRLGDSVRHFSEARELLAGVIEFARNETAPASLNSLAIDAAEVLGELFRRGRTAGLDANDWALWTDTVSWLERMAIGTDASAGTKARNLLSKLDNNPIELLETARWLDESDWSNPGFWRRWPATQVLPRPMRSSGRIQCLISRANGDVVVGTDRGLCVLTKGYWQWYGFNTGAGRFSRMADTDIDAGSNVLALAEDARGRLWIGTAAGLLRLSPAPDAGGDPYEQRVRLWRSEQTGLPSQRVEHIAPLGAEVLVATTRGVRRSAGNKLLPVHAELECSVHLLRRATGDWIPTPVSQDPNQSDIVLERPDTALPDYELLVGTNHGLFAVSQGGDARLLLDQRVDDAIWSPTVGALLVLDNNVIHRMAVREGMGTLTRLRHQKGIQKSQRIQGLTLLPLDSGEWVPVAMTDLGLSFLHAAHFEHLALPKLLAPTQAGVVSANVSGGRSFFLTSEGVWAHERGQVLGDIDGRVYDLVTDTKHEMTFVARGDQIQWIDHNDPATGARHFAPVRATHLALDHEGRLVANDGSSIVRFTDADPLGTRLFDAGWQTIDSSSSYRRGLVYSILPASDGTLWVAAGPSVFRWRDGMVEPEEFSIFVDAERFPSRTHMVWQIIETIDQNIWAIGSNEGHLEYNGTRLHGGVLEWTGEGFERIQLEDETPVWFATGYTAVDDETAIVATAFGFARHRNGHYVSYYDLKDASYLALRDQGLRLWMGTSGARLGDDLYLFGCADGLMAYHDGRWFCPQRLNWLLPDQHLSEYGARQVHAVATDPHGRIYAGTDRGLLIYDSRGSDAIDFLVFNDFDAMAFQRSEMQKLERAADLILGILNDGHPAAGQIRELREIKGEISKLREEAEPSARLAERREDPSGAEHRHPIAEKLSEEERNKVKDRLSEAERRYQKMLARLEREHYGLYQLLELKPLDLAALRREFNDKQIVLQYLPTPDALYIQMVSRELHEVRRVEVDREQLFAKARVVASTLARRGQGRAPSLSIESFGDRQMLSPEELRDALVWLYEALLRPVEFDLKGAEQIYVAAIGPLTYVPFAALISDNTGTPRYAVEDHAFGYLPSMYLLDLVLRTRESMLDDALVLGDAKGDLPGAKREAEEAHDLLAARTPLRLGAEATCAVVRSLCSGVRILHLAVHATLQPYAEDSYISLADCDLRVTDILNLDLAEADLVVLSACETGVGQDRFENATIARAFAHAGAPTTIATLWRIPDAPSVDLIRTFYEHYTKGKCTFESLALAQRAMLRHSNLECRDPHQWAGYVVYGKP